ncbi:MFS transporter [Marinicrinis lubricantis]|uniref:MFS transporter n=1 Tax=Marinicrinis lubricantis TaxID=2086470 RepID=A0ABW1IQS2_9BACL
MRSALWLYLFIFVAFFDLHAQYPILTPFAISLGAAPSFIGYIMGMYSLTHLPGNVMAGYGVDRYGGKWFIVVSLTLGGILLIIQSHVVNPWQLLVIRSISGFVLAFLSPACLAMLAKMAKDAVHQSKLMTGNGIIHTLASVVSPAAGAALVAKLGFAQSFNMLGWGLIASALFAILFVKEPKQLMWQNPDVNPEQPNLEPEPSIKVTSSLLFFCLPMALSCSQGILFFEIPLAFRESENMVLTTGYLFSAISLGSLVTMSFWFLNRVSPLWRLSIGTLGLALLFFALSIEWALPLIVTLFLIGMTKGVIYPSIAAFLAQQSDHNKYGRNFAMLSIAYSIGAFLGPIIAGEVREFFSPYFAAFLVLMIGMLIRPRRNPKTWTSPNNVSI